MANRTPIAPAVGFDPEKASDHVKQAFHALAADQAFLECRTLREQVLYAKDFLSNEAYSGLPVTNVEIARFLNINNDAIVGDIIRRGDNGHEFKGRIPTLDSGDFEAITEWIDEAIAQRSPLTLDDVVCKLLRHRGEEISSKPSRRL